jgi:hypothetical protein
LVSRVVIALLAVVVPLGLVAAVSPVMFTEQLVLLSGPQGRRSAASYAAGAALTLLVFAVVLIMFGRAISLPKAPHLDATLDLVLGALLLGGAVLLRWRRPRTAKPHRTRRAMDARAALPFGIVSMATNFTTLAVIVPAVKDIAATHVGVLGQAVGLVTLLALAAMPAWSPAAFTHIGPGAADRGLHALADFIARRGRLITVLCLAAVGVFLVVRGIVRQL